MDPSPDDAAADAPGPPEVLEEIARRLDVFKRALFGLLDPHDAVSEIDAALALVDRIEPASWREAFTLVLQANAAFAKGMIELRADGEADRARAHFLEAKGLMAKIKDVGLPSRGEQELRPLVLGIETKLVEIDLARAEEGSDEHARLTRRRKELMEATYDLGGQPEDVAFRKALEQFQRSLSAFGDTTRALARLDLEEASRRIEEARQSSREVESLIAEVAEADEVLGRMGEMLSAFGPLISAQQAYVTVLHEAVIGDVRERHVVLLEEADTCLRAGLERLEKASRFLERAIGQLGPFPREELAASIEAQRETFRNLRRLVKEGLTPREVTRRSAPRFAAYFVISLVVLLAGIRLSGISEKLSGTELVSVILIALVVSAGSSFGWEAAIRLFEAMPFARKRGDELPSGQADTV